MKNYVVSWDKKPKLENVKKQAQAIFEIYQQKINEGFSSKDMYVSLSPLMSKFISSNINDFAIEHCNSMPAIIDKSKNNYYLELNYKKITREDIFVFEQEAKKAFREYYNSKRKKASAT